MKTKTFVTDDYQVTLMDDGGIMVLFEGEPKDTCITYHENYKDSWWVRSPDNCRESTFIGGLSLSKSLLEKLYEALKLVDKQGLMDDEIVFVDKEKKVNKKEEPEDKVKEVSNNNFDRVKTFHGYGGAEEAYAKINDYAISHNLRIVSCPEPEEGLYGYTCVTAIFDKL